MKCFLKTPFHSVAVGQQILIHKWCAKFIRFIHNQRHIQCFSTHSFVQTHSVKLSKGRHLRVFIQIFKTYIYIFLHSTKTRKIKILHITRVCIITKNSLMSLICLMFWSINIPQACIQHTKCFIYLFIFY